MPTIPDKPTWPKGTRATITPARTIEAQTITFEAFDFTDQRLRWIDDPNGKTLSAQGIGGQTLVIMGAKAKTPYNPAWTENDARLALLAQLRVPVPQTS
jgi:hypothetical protein